MQGHPHMELFYTNGINTFLLGGGFATLGLPNEGIPNEQHSTYCISQQIFRALES